MSIIHMLCEHVCQIYIGSSMMILLMLNAECGVTALCHLLDYSVNPYSYQWVTHFDVDGFDLFTRLFIPLAAHSDMWLSDLVQPVVG